MRNIISGYYFWYLQNIIFGANYYFCYEILFLVQNIISFIREYKFKGTKKANYLHKAVENNNCCGSPFQ